MAVNKIRVYHLRVSLCVGFDKSSWVYSGIQHKTSLRSLALTPGYAMKLKGHFSCAPLTSFWLLSYFLVSSLPWSELVQVIAPTIWIATS